MVTPEAMVWTGEPQDEPRFAPFLRLADRPGELVIWWMESDLMGRCDLLVSRELTTSDPVRVRPGETLVLSGGELRLGRGGP